MAAQDVAPELLEAVREAFERGMAQDEQLVRLLANITEGGATFADAGEYAARVGEALAAAFGECLSSEVLPEGRMWYNIADRVVRPMLEEDHRLVTTAAAETITAQNRGAGIGMTAQTAPVDEDRIQGILDRVSSEPVYDDAAWLLDAPVVTFSQAAADETLKRNVGVMGKSGLRARIIRKAEHKCCAWCSGLAGTYDYPGAPDDVYRRHEHCRCVVEYDPGKGKQRQNVHSKEWRTAEERGKIKARKDFAASVADVAEQLEARKSASSRPRWVNPIPSEKRTIKQGFEAFPTGDPLKRNVQNVVPDGNKFDVAMHGAPEGVGFGTEDLSMDARELARMILHDSNYKEGQPVRLLSCSTGKQPDDGDYCVAEHLANMLGVEVIAPSDVLTIDNAGNLKVGCYEEGRFVSFMPNQRGRLR